MTLRLRLSLAFLAIVVAPLVAAAIIVGRGVPHALDSSAANRLAASQAGATSWVQQTCTQVRLAAEVLARETAAAAPAARAGTAADIVARGLGRYAVVVSAGGRVISRAGSVPGSSPPTVTALGSCSRRTPPAAGLAVLADAVDVRSSAGADLGRAAVAVPLDASTAGQIGRASGAGVTVLVDGHVAAGTDSAGFASDLAARRAALDTGAVVHVADRLAQQVPVGPGAVAVISVSRGGAHDLVAILVSVLVVAVVLSAAIGTWLARVTTRPLAQLSDAAARVAAGDLDTEITVAGRDEVARLGAAFNEMTRELRTYVRELETSRDQLRGSLARLGDTLSGTHDVGRILTVVLDSAVDSVGAAAGATYVAEPDSQELVLSAARGLDGRAAERQLPSGVGITGVVAATGTPRWGRVGSAGLEPGPGEPTATQLLSVPLRAGNDVLGVLNLYDRIDGLPFDDQDLETIRTFAGHAAVALDNVLLHQEAQRLSLTDALTGLRNYRSFQQDLQREVDRATRFERPLGLLMVDLDLFKAINDTHGHQIGNDVLVEVAYRLRAEVREVDVIARYGGEEFVVILPESDVDGTGHTAERICESMHRRPFRVGDFDLAVTVSVGAAVFPVHARSAADLVRAADEAMYAAKQAGRDQWRSATPLAGDRPSLGLRP